MDAESCTIDFDSTDKCIKVNVTNPRQTLLDAPLWRTASSTALQVYYESNESEYILWDSIEIEITEIRGDSMRSGIQRLSTKDVRLADSIYNLATGFIRGNGTVNIQELWNIFDSTSSESELYSLDSLFESKPTYGDSSFHYGLGGFYYFFDSELSKTVLVMNMQEARGTFENGYLVNEYEIIVDLQKRRIIGFHFWDEEAYEGESPEGSGPIRTL
jgi:hypothetical protein